jgi:hypothetical protein
MCHIDALVYGGEIVWDVSRYLRDTLAYVSGAPLSSQTLPEGAERAAARRLLHQVIDAWEIDAAVLHLEAFVTEGAMTFCEVACRPGGGGIIEAFEVTRGIHLGHAKILVDCGDDPRRLRSEPVAPCAGFTVHYTCRSGVLASLQSWASRGTDEPAAALRRLRLGGLVAAGATAIVALGGVAGGRFDAAILVAAVVGLTLAELWIIAGGGGMLLQYMPEGERPGYLAAFNLGFGAATVVGPPLVALGAAGPAWTWLAWSAFFAIVACAVSLLPSPRSTHALCTG